MRVLGSLKKLGFLFCVCIFIFTRCGGGAKDYVNALTQVEIEEAAVGDLSLSEDKVDFKTCLKESITEAYPSIHSLVDENVDVFYDCQEKTNDSVTDSDKRELAGDLVGWSQKSLLAHSSLALTESGETKSVIISLLSKLKPHLDPFDDEDMSVIAEKSLFVVNEAEVEPFPEEILEGMYEGVVAYSPKGQGSMMAAQLAGNYMHQGGTTLSVYASAKKDIFYTSVMRKVSELIAGITVKQDSKDTLAENLFVKVLGSSMVKEKKKDEIIDVIAEILLNKDQDKKTSLKQSAILIVLNFGSSGSNSDGSDNSTTKSCSGGESKLIRYKDADEDGRYVASSAKICSSSTYPKVASDLTEDELANLDDDDSTDWDTDDDNVANSLDVCPGTNDALLAYRYKDSDEDGLYEKSTSKVCVDDTTYTVAASELTAGELANLDDDATTHWDLDGDGVANDDDECPGLDDALMAYRYKDDDEDGLYEKSLSEVCPDDETYTVAASELTAGELANLDDDPETHWDLDGDGVANDDDECPGLDDALLAYRYKDDDEDGAYAKSPEEVCPDDETYTVAADGLTNDEKTNLDADDSTPDDSDGDGIIDNVDECPGEDDAEIAIRYKDADDDGLMVPSEGELCPDDATYTFAAGDLHTYQTTVPDSDDSDAYAGAYTGLTTDEETLGYDFDGDSTPDENETIYVINNVLAFANWIGSTDSYGPNHALLLKDVDYADCDGNVNAICDETTHGTQTWSGYHVLDGAGNKVTFGTRSVSSVGYGVLFKGFTGGIVRDITIDIDITNDTIGLGGLFGVITSTTHGEVTISNVTIEGSLTGLAPIGGVIASISNNTQNLNVSNTVNKSIIVGTECDNTDGVAGILGNTYSSKGVITDTGNEGDVTCDDGESRSYSVAGIIGYIGSLNAAGMALSSVYNTGDIYGYSYLGGIVGEIQVSQDYLMIEDCYNTGDLHSIVTTGTKRVGGIVGNLNGNNSYIKRCYSSGTITTDSSTPNGLDPILGGLEGGLPSFENNFFLAGKVAVQNPQPNNTSATELTLVNMKKQASFTGFNFGTCTDGAYTTEATCEAAEETWTQLWRISEDSTYPYLYGITPTSLPGSG